MKSETSRRAGEEAGRGSPATATGSGPAIAGSAKGATVAGDLIIHTFLVQIESALEGEEAWARAKAFADPGNGPVGALVGVGCDTETRARLRQATERHPDFVERWFDADERAAIDASDDPLGETLRRFCLKEAIIKALWQRVRLTPRQVGTGGGSREWLE